MGRLPDILLVILLVILLLALLTAPPLTALEPPTAEQLARYRRDGTLHRRLADARRFGHHRVAPHLVAQLAARHGLTLPARPGAKDTGERKGLRTTGTNSLFALLIAFADHQGQSNPQTVTTQLFGDGLPSDLPYDGLHSFYLRSSYGQLDLRGSVLGWYTTRYSRAAVAETSEGRQQLLMEVINHYDSNGHDFSRYDNDGDGTIDYFIVLWAGPRDEEWASFWWGYQASFDDPSFTVDGKRLGTYSWQDESRGDSSVCAARCIRTICHETGHALGLPDYYDYDEAVGPPGGLGRIDLMAGPGGHNAFSKILLGWVTPTVYNQGDHTVTMTAADAAADVALLMHGEPRFPFGEYFLVENRRRQGNYRDDPGEGLLIWHVDARLSDSGELLYDNSYTEHKLLRLMEADGLEEIEQGLDADAEDYYRRGDLLSKDTRPNSHRYDGAPTNLRIGGISDVGDPMTFAANVGTGCAIFCAAAVPETSWPNTLLLLDASATTLANCSRSNVSLRWTIGDGTEASGELLQHSFTSRGSYPWHLSAELGNSSCSREGTIQVCTDERCWGWLAETAMASARTEHSAVLLADGRVLVAGGEGPPELYDPLTATWTAAGELQGSYAGAQLFLLSDGRVLLTGGTAWDSPVNTEVYDPASGTWQVTGQMARSCFGAAATQLRDGSVLVAGGLYLDQGYLDGCYQSYLFSPSSESWSPAGTLREALYRPGLTAMADGRALLTGYGEVGLFDPAGLRWSWSQTYDYPWRGYHTSVLLADGRVLIAGGFYTEMAEIYDPRADRWTYTEEMQSGRVGATATLLPSGRVLVCGGSEGGRGIPPTPLRTLSSAELYDPASRSWLQVAPMSEPRYDHTAVLLADGTVLILGGRRNEQDGSQSYLVHNSVERYRPPGPGIQPPRRPGGRVAGRE